MAMSKVAIAKYVIFLGIDSFQTDFLLVQVKEHKGDVSVLNGHRLWGSGLSLCA